MFRLLKCTAMLALLVLALATGAMCSSWDPAADFSSIQNPNGVWTYGYQYVWGQDFTQYNSPGTPISGICTWSETGVPWFTGRVYKNTTSQGIASSGNIWLEGGQLALWPGESGEFATVRWTSPISGYVSIQAKFTGQSPNANCTTTDVHVLHNGATVFDGNINGFIGTLSNNFTDGVGSARKQSYAGIVHVESGDTIDFAVCWGVNEDCYDDLTGLAAKITTVADEGATVTGKVTSSVTLPGGTTAITDRGGVDTFVDQGSSTPQGSNTLLYVQNCGWNYSTEEGYGTVCPIWQWDLDLDDGDSITSVSSAIVRIDTAWQIPNGTTIRFYRLTAPFDESSIVWENRPERDDSAYVECEYVQNANMQIDVSSLLEKNGSLSTFGLQAELVPTGGYWFSRSKEDPAFASTTTRLDATYVTETTITDRAGVDSFVEQGSSTPQGSNTLLYVQNCGWNYSTEEGYGTVCPIWQWDLDLDTEESITTVSSAKIKISTAWQIPNGTTIRFYRLTAPFDESSVIWSNRPPRDSSAYVDWSYVQDANVEVDVSSLLEKNGSLNTFGLQAEFISPAGYWFSRSKEDPEFASWTTRLSTSYSTKPPSLVPIPNATVKVDGTDIEATTDANGDYTIAVPSSPSWTLGGTPIPYTVTARLGIDSFVEQGSSTLQGSNTLLYMQNCGWNYSTEEGYGTVSPIWQWDLDLGTNETIQSVSSATMQLSTAWQVPNGTTIRFYRLTAPFDESSVIWGNRPPRDSSVYIDWSYIQDANVQIDVSSLLAQNGTLSTFGLQAEFVENAGYWFSRSKDDQDFTYWTTRLNASYDACDVNSAVLTGNIDLTASAVGYAPQTKNTTVVLGQSVTKDFSLEPAAVLPSTQPFVYSDSVVIDGNLSEWNDSEFIPIDQYYDYTANLDTDIPEAYFAGRWGDGGNKVYVAVKVRDTAHYFTDTYDAWNTRDAAEIYIHTTGTGPVDYSGTQADAQQYSVGFKASAPTQLWTAVGAGLPIPAAADFQAVGHTFGQWLYYEAALTPFEYFSLDGNDLVVSTLSAGQVIGVDVVIAGHDLSDYSGMKSANVMGSKWRDYEMIGKHVLLRNDSIGDVRNAANNSSVQFNAVISAAFEDYFYVETADRVYGIRVNKAGHGLVAGQTAYISGTVQTLLTGERYVSADTIWASGGGSGIAPLGLTNKALGGAAGGGQPGIDGGTGLNNIGLLVKTTGYIVDTSGQPTSFKIDDGSAVEVIVLGVVPTGADYVSVTGISSCEMDSECLVREIIATDIQSE